MTKARTSTTRAKTTTFKNVALACIISFLVISIGDEYDEDDDDYDTDGYDDESNSDDDNDDGRKPPRRQRRRKSFIR